MLNELLSLSSFFKLLLSGGDEAGTFSTTSTSTTETAATLRPERECEREYEGAAAAPLLDGDEVGDDEVDADVDADADANAKADAVAVDVLLAFPVAAVRRDGRSGDGAAEGGGGAAAAPLLR